VRSTKVEISDEHRPQGSPCPYCGKRTRLNAGLVQEWFDKQDARLYAREENRLNGFAIPQIGGEQSGE